MSSKGQIFLISKFRDETMRGTTQYRLYNQLNSAVVIIIMAIDWSNKTLSLSNPFFLIKK